VPELVVKSRCVRGDYSQPPKARKELIVLPRSSVFLLSKYVISVGPPRCGDSLESIGKFFRTTVPALPCSFPFAPETAFKCISETTVVIPPLLTGWGFFFRGLSPLASIRFSFRARGGF